MRKKIEIFLITLGSMFEWFDYMIYLSFSNVLAMVFFPHESQEKQLLFILLIFAIAYVARPLGGIGLGAWADKWGRKKIFLVSTLIMALATLGIACLPGYGKLGPFSFLLLLLLRLCQAFSVGGEYAIGVAYLSEKSILQRGFIASFFIFATLCGVLLAFLCVAGLRQYFSETALIAWAWRLPFFCSFIFLLLNLACRHTLSPSGVFQREKARGHLYKNPLRMLLQYKKRRIMQIVLYAAFPEVAVYTYMTMLPTFITKYSGTHLDDTLGLQIFGVLILLCALPLGGMLSDKINRIKQYVISICLLTALSFLSVVIFKDYSHHLSLILGFNALLGICLAASNAPLPAMLAEQANTSLRCSTFGLGYNLAAAIFGGTTPLFATYLSTQGDYYFGFYLLFVLGLSIAGVSSFVDKRAKSIDCDVYATV